jgi:hypothetical protein
MQGWRGATGMSGLSSYKAMTGANPFVYSMDLKGYGSLQFPEDKTFVLAGFSEKVFDLMALLETDRAALVNTIKAVTI